ncbi:MAG TPA: methyltransferase regulatory domain-containing protein [Gemmataceae bacterium]|nr:methyltransferase regulatory domain-containing protein [Gemmataceae bacterium]
MIERLQASYEAVPYLSRPFPETHPSRLAVFGTLFGMTPAPVHRCRVLELGCAGGGNLIPMGVNLPDSDFTGIDLSAGHVAAGRQTIEALGLTNIALEQMDIVDFPPDAGRFDYIIAHGVYSWVPAAVQEKLLSICKDHLAPQGIAYVSHNVFPGWHARGLARELMLFHTRQTGDPQARAREALAVLAFASNVTAFEKSVHGDLIKSEWERLRHHPSYLLLHDELGLVNQPSYFHEFMERAAQHGLQFLTDAESGRAADQHVPREVLAAVEQWAADTVSKEQYFDFLCNRAFRRTLLCHREVSLHATPMPEKLAGLYVASEAHFISEAPDLTSPRAESFAKRGRVTASTGHPLSKAAIACLAELWPKAIAFADLRQAAQARLDANGEPPKDPAVYVHDTQALAVNLFQAFTARLVELHAQTPQFATAPGLTPRASRYARWQAAHGSYVTNQRHEFLPLDENLRLLLAHLDGAHNREALLTSLGEKAPAIEQPVSLHTLDSLLQRLGHAALLVE